jgi:hypothetical protein
MAFILSKERDSLEPNSVEKAFRHYAAYLTDTHDRFPSSAYTLATSDWYYGAHDSRSPHDAWLESLTISEAGEGKRREHRAVTIRVVLLSAYHDGLIELLYPRVFNYQLDLHHTDGRHGDWRYDEFRLADNSHPIHEIEWSHRNDIGRWLIEADDVHLSWQPFGVRAVAETPRLDVE